MPPGKILTKSLDRLESEMKGRSYLSGDGKSFGMGDVAMAPFVYRMSRWKERGWIDLLRNRPTIAAWRGRVMARPSVIASVPVDWENLDVAAAKKSDSLVMKGKVSL